MNALLDMLDFLVGPAAIVALAGLLCRFDKLRYGRHKLSIIALHGALACACGFAAYHAWLREAGALDLFSVAAALSWLWVSLPTWRHGAVPPQFEKSKPRPLEAQQLHHVNGGRS